MAPRARLAVCITAFEYGGQGTVVDHELRLLQGEFDLTLVAERITRPVPAGVRAVQIPAWSMFPVSNPRLRALLGTFDLVHCHDSLGFMLGAALANRRFVVTSHGIAPLRYRVALRSKVAGAVTLATYPVLYRAARLVIGISSYISEWLRGFAHVRAITIGNGAPDVLAEHYEPPTRRTLLYVGEISRRKGIHELIAAQVSLPIDVSLDLVGKGDPAPFLGVARRDGVLDRVRFHGELTQSELMEFYRTAFCTCSASYWEGFGLPIVEGFSLGRPAIARSVGGMLELIQASQAGCCTSNFAELGSCVKFISDNWQQLSQRALNFALRNSWENTFAQYRELFRGQLNG